MVSHSKFIFSEEEGYVLYKYAITYKKGGFRYPSFFGEG